MLFVVPSLLSWAHFTVFTLVLLQSGDSLVDQLLGGRQRKRSCIITSF